MSTLTPTECRVLGVLVEKAQTTPAQYPLTLNALISGCNQKSNRLPVLTLSEDDVLDSLDSLRAKQLAREVMMTGSRVSKYKHVARETLDVDTNQLVVLIELLLRGPQTVGEIRGRASRMHQLDSVDAVEALLDGLMRREPAIVQRLAPAPGSRASRYAQLLCHDLHPTDVAAAPVMRAAAPPAADPGLVERVAQLEREVAQLKELIATSTSGGHDLQ